MVCYCINLLLLFAAIVAAVNAQDIQVVSQKSFTDELSATLYEDERNECTSSLGVSMAFALVYPTMIDGSKIEVAEVLGFPENNTSVLIWNETQTELNTLYDGSCLIGDFETICDLEQPTVVISNSIWVDSGDGRTLNIAYERLVQDLLFNIDFSATDAGTTVNQWVDTASRGLIDSIVDDAPLNPLILLAVNAIYMKANWLSSFEESRTNQDIFYKNDGLTPVRQDALFMHKVDFYQYSHEAVPGFQIVQIPFVDETLSMIFVLPTGSTKLNSAKLIDIIPDLESTTVALAIPKFKFESEYEDNLKNALQTIGIVEPFLGGLCIYEGDCDAYIDLIIQKTYISLDEKGVEAAAVTAIGAREFALIDQPVLMQLDRPFQFFIYDSNTDLIIFEGQVVNPIPQDDAPTAVQFTARHSDSNFWMDNFFVDPIVIELAEGSTTDMPTVGSPTRVPTRQPTATPGVTISPTTAPITKRSTSSAKKSDSASTIYYFSAALAILLIIN